jgi:hypothetical protein
VCCNRAERYRGGGRGDEEEEKEEDVAEMAGGRGGGTAHMNRGVDLENNGERLLLDVPLGVEGTPALVVLVRRRGFPLV